MNFLKIQNILKNFFTYIVFVVLSLTAIFTRSFLGLSIFSFRLGEILIAFGFIISIYLLFFGKPKSIFKFKQSKISFIFKLIIIYFLLRMFLNINQLSLYNFKSSSFIWTIAFLYFGLIIANLSENNLFLKSLFYFVPIIIYIFQSGNYPDFIIKFFQTNSDKFQFMKASDMVIAIIISSLFSKFYPVYKNIYVYWTLFLIALFLPLVAANSRGAVVGIVLFLILFLITNIKIIISLKYQNIILLTILICTFSASSLRVSGASFDSPDKQVSEKILNEIPDAVKKIANEKNTEDVFLSFYFENKRIYSTDPTTNWRLDIWQDVYEDLLVNERLLRGYGYSEIIPVMKDPTAPGRLGRDGLNEHVHNYFVTIFARGGYLNLILFIFLHFSLVKYLYKSKIGADSLLIVIPCLFMSLVDITMDGVQFPLQYYFFIGYFLNHQPIKT